MALPHSKIIRGPLLNPRSDRLADYFPDGAIAADATGTISFVGEWAAIVRDSAGRLSARAMG